MFVLTFIGLLLSWDFSCLALFLNLNCLVEDRELAAPQCAAGLHVRLNFHRIAPFFSDFVSFVQPCYAFSNATGVPKVTSRFRRMSMSRIALIGKEIGRVVPWTPWLRASWIRP
jgi:hypothetical protein